MGGFEQMTGVFQEGLISGQGRNEPMTRKAAEIKEGDKAPDFSLPTDGGGKVTLSKFRGRPVVLYFYPKDDTSGCTAEACSFRDNLPKFGKIEAEVIGISRDAVASHDKFKKK
jgi:peroxiredoxin Q/BCP